MSSAHHVQHLVDIRVDMPGEWAKWNNSGGQNGLNSPFTFRSNNKAAVDSQAYVN